MKPGCRGDTGYGNPWVSEGGAVSGFRAGSEPLHFATLWEAIADEIPAAPALTHGTRTIGWGEFELRAARLAGALRAHGLGPGSVVACYLYNCPEYFETFLAALKIRAVPANVNYRYGGAELRALLENCEAEALFFDSALRERVASIRHEVPGVRLVVEVGESSCGVGLPGGCGYQELIASSEPAPRMSRSEQDVFLSYTGGTTGLPKGVRYAIGRGVANSLRLREEFLGTSSELGILDYAAEQVRSGHRLVSIPASPLMHSTGFTFASLPTLTSGGQVATLVGRSFDARELLATIGAVRAQVVAIVGDAFALPLLRALDAGAPDGRYETSSLRTICSAGTAWSAHVKQRLLVHLPQAALLDFCGSTEGVTYGFRRVRRGEEAVTANFEAARGLRVIGPDRRELPQGEVGLLAGPTPAAGYHKDPQRSATTFFTSDGEQLAAPGDLGRIEADGSVTLIGRGSSVINTGGEKVHPAEVEEVINRLACVEECLVAGVPDERFGQLVAAIVVTATDRHVDASDVIAAARRSLAGYKVPRLVVFAEEVPRSPNGKIDYAAARAVLADQLGAGAAHATRLQRS
jgi:acyl-CoA synthetase (AMP-forming)/AMP-acid ligase II